MDDITVDANKNARDAPSSPTPSAAGPATKKRKTEDSYSKRAKTVYENERKASMTGKKREHSKRRTNRNQALTRARKSLKTQPDWSNLAEGERRRRIKVAEENVRKQAKYNTDSDSDEDGAQKPLSFEEQLRQAEIPADERRERAMGILSTDREVWKDVETNVEVKDHDDWVDLNADTDEPILDTLPDATAVEELRDRLRAQVNEIGQQRWLAVLRDHGKNAQESMGKKLGILEHADLVHQTGSYNRPEDLKLVNIGGTWSRLLSLDTLRKACEAGRLPLPHEILDRKERAVFRLAWTWDPKFRAYILRTGLKALQGDIALPVCEIGWPLNERYYRAHGFLPRADKYGVWQTAKEAKALWYYLRTAGHQKKLVDGEPVQRTKLEGGEVLASVTDWRLVRVAYGEQNRRLENTRVPNEITA